MNVLIWGAGAIGGTLGAYFQRAGHDVLFVDASREHVDAINEQGLRITGPIEEFQVAARACTPEELAGTFARILLCVKAHHTRQALPSLVPALASNGYIASIQNGLNEEEIAQVVGRDKVIGAFVNFGADYLEPGVVHFGGRGAVVLGELDGRMTPRLVDLHALFLHFDKAAITTPNIMGYLWGKLAYGSLLFATALTHDSIADALARPAYLPLFTAIAREVVRVAEAEGVQPEGFDGFDPAAFGSDAGHDAAAGSIADLVAFNRKSAKSHSGIWRDLAVRKRKTEVDAQLGAVVRHGRAAGVPTPLVNQLIALTHEIEDGKRELSADNLHALLQSHLASQARS
ncbi:MAG TPA: 2-dehydropantoate 2-reductase [Trueperaceae bacterium]